MLIFHFILTERDRPCLGDRTQVVPRNRQTMANPWLPVRDDLHGPWLPILGLPARALEASHNTRYDAREYNNREKGAPCQLWKMVVSVLDNLHRPQCRWRWGRISLHYRGSQEQKQQQDKRTGMTLKKRQEKKPGHQKGEC